MILYALRDSGHGQLKMAKFDDDFNCAATYTLTRRGAGYTCDCPASARAVKLKPCKHQRWIPFMMGALNSDRFYDPETGNWHAPLPHELTKEGYDGGEAVEIASPSSSPTPEQPAPSSQTSTAAQVVEAPVEGPSRRPPAPTHPTIARRL